MSDCDAKHWSHNEMIINYLKNDFQIMNVCKGKHIDHVDGEGKCFILKV